MTDVSDGMDILGRQDLGLMDPAIRPLVRDVERLSHRFVGFAHTVRFVPTNHPVTARSPEEMKEFMYTIVVSADGSTGYQFGVAPAWAEFKTRIQPRGGLES